MEVFMKKMVYDWKSGARFKVDPQVVGEEIARLKRPTAAQIVAAAASGADALYELFDQEGLWDDSIAAERARTEFAQKVARNLVVTVKVEGDEINEPVVVRAFETVTVTPNEPRQYVPVMKALSRDEWRDEVLGRLTHDLEAARRQISNYSYLSDRMGRAEDHVEKAVAELAAAKS
jgi:hypothetical protein